MIFPTPIPDELLPDPVNGELMCRLESVYRKYARELFIACYAQCNDREKANDAVHESFLRLYARGPGDLPDVRSWLTTVGVKWLIELARAEQRRRRPTSDLNHAATAQPLWEDVLEQLEREHLRAALRKLRDSDRNILLLKYMMSWKPTEICQHFDITAEDLCARYNRVRRRLIQILNDQGLNALPQQ